MKLIFWAVLSKVNKHVLPKIHRRPDLLSLSSLDKAVVGWKMYVTYNYLDALKLKSNKS
jgi:hypothetical protein